MGRNKSRVKSRISEPIAPIAAPYRSRRILDSITKNSANKRTLSASLVADASFSANVAKRSTVPRANCWVVCVTTTCFVRTRVGERGAPEDARLPVGGVGSALGAMAWYVSGCFWATRGDRFVGVNWSDGIWAEFMAEAEARGVEPLEGWLLSADSPVLGPSEVRPDRGVPLLIVNRLWRPEALGITISLRPWWSSDASIEFRPPVLVRLSLRRWRSVLSRTACCLAKCELDEDAADSGFALELPLLTVSMA